VEHMRVEYHVAESNFHHYPVLVYSKSCTVENICPRNPEKYPLRRKMFMHFSILTFWDMTTIHLYKALGSP
jgi:hypothetical protein